MFKFASTLFVCLNGVDLSAVKVGFVLMRFLDIFRWFHLITEKNSCYRSVTEIPQLYFVQFQIWSPKSKIEHNDKKGIVATTVCEICVPVVVTEYCTRFFQEYDKFNYHFWNFSFTR
jgi:hypothetical protein